MPHSKPPSIRLNGVGMQTALRMHATRHSRQGSKAIVLNNHNLSVMMLVLEFTLEGESNLIMTFWLWGGF
jgi:hypothetical protein